MSNSWCREDHPIAFTGRRRDTSLSWTVDVISERRQFRHLTKAAIRSYLLYVSLGEAEHSHEIVRCDLQGLKPSDREYLTSQAPFYIRYRYRAEGLSCEHCGHTEYREYSKRVLVDPSAATKAGRREYTSGLAFDVGNAMTQIAWRLGLSCIVCGAFMGLRIPQVVHDDNSIIGRLGTVLAPVCPVCRKNERRDIAKWNRAGHRSNPTEEWLLLMAVERMAKNAAKSARKSA